MIRHQFSNTKITAVETQWLWHRNYHNAIKLEVENGGYVFVDVVLSLALLPLAHWTKKSQGQLRCRPYTISRPHNQSINAYTNNYKRKLSTLTQACAMLQPGSWMANCDLFETYMSIPTAPRYWRLHVLEWQSMVNLDIQLPFGIRAAQGVFDRPTQAIVRSTQRVGSEM